MEDFFQRLFRSILHPNVTVEHGEPGVAPTLVHWLDVTPVDSKDKPCELVSLDVKARVRGVYSEVTQTIVIKNPNPRPLSTSVSIPLPDQATVCGYALDIDGQMVDGVVVPKEKARVVFETEQRRGADPGLVEAVRGNAYRTRVYPVPPHGTRTMRLRYVSPLHIDAEGSAVLDLPMPGEHLDRRTIAIAVERLDDHNPMVSGLAGASVRVTGADWSVSSDETDVTPTEPVLVAMPPLPESLVLLERDTNGKVWFCASDKAPAVTTENAPDITSLTVLWDASGSRATQDHTREIELLRAYASPESIQSITLVVFADHVREIYGLSSADELCARVADVRYDGGTNFSELTGEMALMDNTLARAGMGGACVLFTDGLDTLCDETFKMPSRFDVAAIVSGNERDVEAMRQGCKGLAFEISLAPANAAELMSALCNGGKLGLWGVGGRGIADTVDASTPGSGRRIAIGRLATDEATLTLGSDEAPIALRAEDAREGSMIASAWASRRVSLLSPRADENADELLKLGRSYGVVSPATSLIVLESFDQWLRYDIEPPRTLEKIHEAWERAQAGKMRLSSEGDAKMRHRTNLIDSWTSYLNWWKREYPEPRQENYDGLRRSIHEPMDSGQFGSTGDLSAVRYLISDIGDEADAMESMLISDIGDETYAMESMPASALFDELMEDEALADCALPDCAPDFDSAPAPITEVNREYRPPRERVASMRAMAASGVRERRASRAGAIDALNDEPQQADPSMSVAVKPWMPDAPYLKALDEAALAADSSKARDAYFEQRKSYLSTPSFFLDCAGWFMAHGDEEFGVSVLTNLAEMRIEDATVLRVMAWRLREAGRLEQALVTLRRVLKLRREDSQSHRDLSLVLTELARKAYEQGNEQEARAYALEAGELLRTTALTPWARRPMAIGLFAVEEYNVFRAWVDAQAWEERPDLPSLGDDLEGVPDCDLRITLAWDADETDVDLHVTEPSGVEAYYANRLTDSGGRVSEDITDGFGPEQYEIRKAREGIYVIRAHYYASHQQTVFGPATCTLTVFTDWGRPNQAQTITTTRLDRAKSMVPVGTASYGTASSESCDEAEPKDERSIELGMSAAQVAEILGEPQRTSTEGDKVTSVWDHSGGRSLLVEFVDGLVVKVAEAMPWGELMIVAQ